MRQPQNHCHHWRRLAAVLMVLGSAAAAAEPMLYRGEYIYVVPEVVSDKMAEFAAKESWSHFPKLTRFIDTDNDGKSDFIAIALGAVGGFGAQIRYRLMYAENGDEPQLGSWYWCVITDEAGEKIFEQFNP